MLVYFFHAIMAITILNKYKAFIRAKQLIKVREDKQSKLQTEIEDKNRNRIHNIIYLFHMTLWEVVHSFSFLGNCDKGSSTGMPKLLEQSITSLPCVKIQHILFSNTVSPIRQKGQVSDLILATGGEGHSQKCQ